MLDHEDKRRETTVSCSGGNPQISPSFEHRFFNCMSKQENFLFYESIIDSKKLVRQNAIWNFSLNAKENQLSFTISIQTWWPGGWGPVIGLIEAGIALGPTFTS